MLGWFWGSILLLGIVLFWLLSDPSRAVDPKFYDTPRRVLVVGCSGGMGQRMVKTLRAKNHKVVATDLAVDDGTGDTDDFLTKKLDVTKRQDWEAVLSTMQDKWGGVDLMVNVAGYLRPGRTQNLIEVDIDRHIDINLKGVIHGTQLAGQLMMKQDSGGHIINVSSLGALAPVSGTTLYQASKYGCRGFCLCAAKDLETHGVYVSVVLPDATQTPMVDLQKEYEEASMAFSGSILTIDDIEKCLLNQVMYSRAVEVWLPSEAVRGWGAGILGNFFHSSRLYGMTQTHMKEVGLKRQEQIKKSK